jgi:sensor histidine kinase YesM
MIRKYLQLQQLRFAGEDDRISFTVSAPADTQQVPPMVLLTLVENAIKHSDVFENPEGFVNLNINIAESEVEFSLSNSFEKKANRSQGIGLSTVRLQLQLHFGDNFRLTTRDHNAVYHLTLLFHAG